MGRETLGAQQIQAEESWDTLVQAVPCWNPGRKTQKPLGTTPCEFDSHLRHQHSSRALPQLPHRLFHVAILVRQSFDVVSRSVPVPCCRQPRGVSKHPSQLGVCTVGAFLGKIGADDLQRRFRSIYD